MTAGRLALGALAILVVPIIVGTVDPGHGTVYWVALGLYLSVSLALLVLSFTLRPGKRPDGSIDEPAADRRATNGALLGAVVIANAVLVFSNSRLNLAPPLCGFAIVWTLFWLLPSTRRVVAKTQVEINRDVNSVFGFMADMRNETQYMPELVSVEKITPGDIGPGTRFRSLIRVDDASTFDGVEEIVEMEWGRRITDRMANGRRPNIGVMTFEPMGSATRLAYRFEAEVSYAGALLGQGLLRWATVGEMRRRRREAWARLKQYLESTPHL